MKMAAAGDLRSNFRARADGPRASSSERYPTLGRNGFGRDARQMKKEETESLGLAAPNPGGSWGSNPQTRLLRMPPVD